MFANMCVLQAMKRKANAQEVWSVKMQVLTIFSQFECESKASVAGLGSGMIRMH